MPCTTTPGSCRPSEIARTEATIDAIEARTGAEVVVYTQDSRRPTRRPRRPRRKARALIDQWGIGRAGFDDGMVIFFDLDPSLEHGQVQLYAAPGFEAAFLSNSERQAIFETTCCRGCATPTSTARCGSPATRSMPPRPRSTPPRSRPRARSMPWSAWSGRRSCSWASSAGRSCNWRRFGKDPVYLDDPSILMPAPPPDLTAASGAMIMDGATSRRALTTAMLDLASRGLIAFREDPGGLFSSRKVGIDVGPPPGDAMVEAQRARNARRPTGPAEESALTSLRTLGGGEGRRLHHDRRSCPSSAPSVAPFDKRARSVTSSTAAGSSRSRARSSRAGAAVAFWPSSPAGSRVFAGFNIPFAGLTLIGAAALAGGLVILVFARAMPAVTMSGAMIRAMLAAYRRTLQKTMAQARSMQQVVDEAGLEWLDTPDQAVVWGTALGLQSEIETVLARSLEDIEQGRTSGFVPYFPAWYQNSDGAAFTSSSVGGSGASLFSGSGIPDIGGMMSAIGTVGNSPSSSGGSGGGGFSGGSSGGGGGGSGGGF